MAKSAEDQVPNSSTYAWTKDSDIAINSFLKKLKPSMVQDDGTKPWIWVKTKDAPEETGMDDATEEATTYLKEVTAKVEAIQNDKSIPARSNKKTGAKSKKELREIIQAEATEKLKEISIRHKVVSGKWLIFAANEKVDSLWSTLATSLVSGALASTPAYGAKVATCPAEQKAGANQHVMCLYLPDIYEKKVVRDVMEILLGQCGFTLSGVKSNLYTAIDLSSKHPSGIQSTVWKNSALMKDDEMKDLKDSYFESRRGGYAGGGGGLFKATTPPPALIQEEDAPPKAAEAVVEKKKAVLAPKKKAAKDVFGSDDEEDKGDKKRSAEEEVERPKKKQAI